MCVESHLQKIVTSQNTVGYTQVKSRLGVMYVESHLLRMGNLYYIVRYAHMKQSKSFKNVKGQ